MEAYFEQIRPVLTGYVPRLLVALGILVLGWIIARIGAAITRGILKRTSVDNKIAKWATDDKTEEGPGVEELAGKVVFWILMVFVLVAFFSVLQLPAVTEPLSGFLDEIFGFLPNLISAAVLVLVAWLVATAARFAVGKGLAATGLDDRLSSGVGEDEGAIPASKALAETVYWLVFLLFLPAVLDALELGGLLAPVNEMLSKVMAYLPNVFVALLALAVGWFVARIVQRVVAGLLTAAGTDGLGERLGVDKVIGERSLSSLLSYVVYVLILIPVVIAALDALQIDALTEPASDMLNQILAAIPQVFAAGVVIFVAYLIARLVSELVTRLLAGIGFDRILQRIGFRTADDGDITEGRRPSELVGYIVLIAVMLAATIEALELLNFERLAGIVAAFTVFAGNVLVGVIILAVGFYLASLAAGAVRSSSLRGADLMGNLAQAAIVILATAMALRQAGLAEDIINLAFGILLGAVGVAIALAFGLGGRDMAARQLESWLGGWRRDL